MSIQQAAESVYLKFCSLTTRADLLFPWDDLPMMIKEAWIEVVKESRALDIK